MKEDQRSRETATILAALRFYQQGLDPSAERRDVVDIASDGGELEPLSAEEIDELCERLNLGGGEKPESERGRLLQDAIGRGCYAVGTLRERMEDYGGPETLKETFTAELSEDDEFGGDVTANVEMGVILGMSQVLGAALGRKIEPWDLEKELKTPSLAEDLRSHQLTSEDGESGLRTRVDDLGDGLLLYADGYGHKVSRNGEGAIALLSFWDGKLRLHVWSDIEEEDATHMIDLEGAREASRRGEAQ